MILDALFNFQYGDAYADGPSCFDWLSLGLNLLFVLIGFIVAFAVYFKQRRDNEKDAYILFHDGLDILKEAVSETIEKLGTFSKELQNPNDNFSNPSLSASLNDKIISKIDLTALKRYYGAKDKANLPRLRAFLKATGFFGDYHNYFINEFNVVRTFFFHKEEKFMQYQLLFNNLFYEVLAQRYEPHNNDFAMAYINAHQAIFANAEIIDADHNMLDRNTFNTAFVVPMAELSGKYVQTDAMANTINQVANEVNAARIDMNSVKGALKKLIDKDVVKFKELELLINSLVLKHTD